MSELRGCPFINYANEFLDPSHPGHRVVEASKREWRRRVTVIAERLGAICVRERREAR